MSEIRGHRTEALVSESGPVAGMIEGLPSKLSRYSRAKARATEMRGYLSDIGQPRLALKLNSCGNWLLFHFYVTVNKVRLVNACFCRKHLLCPLCAIRRGAKQLKSYLDRFEVVKAENPGLGASLVTLTVKNGDDLAERFDHLREGVKTLNQRRKDSLRGRAYASEWSKVLGLVGTYEVTNKGKGWHPHTHLIVLHRDPISEANLRAEWKGITGDSFQVDVTPIRNPDNPVKDFCEVFKYSMKFADLSLSDNYQAFLTLSGRRLIYSAGLFWGVKVPEDLRDEALDDLPYIEMLYEYRESGGYNFVKQTDGPT